ncbi:MAG: AMP-binding protein [Actinobacteria bacterium]|nr:AMP-binding protein [Actinomycetota bacterium]
MTPLLTRIENAACAERGITFVGPAGVDAYTSERVSWARLHDDARRMAGALQARGIGPGAHVALLGPTSRAFVTAIQATWLTGATVVVLPLPLRLGSIEEFVSASRSRMLHADVDLLVADPQLAAFLERREDDPPFVMLDDLARRCARYDAPKPDPDGLAILQFTSGSTADPRGVMLPHSRLLANVDAATSAARVVPSDDVVVSWLPLYHDMGLVGLLTIPMLTGTDLVLAAPQDFLAAPVRWLRWMSDFRATITAGPNFSYALATRALGRVEGLDLSRWRIALNGAEPVDPATVEAFAAAAAQQGFDPRAVFCAFGMAELAIAGTFPEPLSGMVTDTVARDALEHDGRAVAAADGPGTRRFARLGRPVPGLEMRIVDPLTGTATEERCVGELEIRGTSVMTGYYARPDATDAVFHDGWLRTGDLAYTVEGELVVCGRMKDLIIVGGRNVLPEDVERAAAGVDGVRTGNVIAFGAERRTGREAVVVVAETRETDVAHLRDAVAARVRDAVGVPAADVVLVPPGTLAKTSSGKLQRSLCKTRYAEGELVTV